MAGDKERRDAKQRKHFSEEVQDDYFSKGAFENFNISPWMVNNLQKMGIKYFFPVQMAAFQPIMEGRDVVMQARTGTGKTIAFAVPIIEKLMKAPDTTHGRFPKVLVLAPTRELAKQTANVFSELSSHLSVLAVYGGTSYGPQEIAIRSGIDILCGTPGRIQDLMNKQTLNLDDLEYVVLDEVDRMMDMGFADSVDDIIKHRYQQKRRGDTSENPQTLMFSATLPGWIHKMIRRYLRDDSLLLDLVGHDTVRTSTTVKHLALKCPGHSVEMTIADLLQVHVGNYGRAMVFCETKREADRLAISSLIKQETHVLHGDIPQDKREMVLQKFREGRYRCLITTDVAARGLDIPEVDLVIMCSPPKDVDSYIHRSGRTGRAGRAGVSVLLYNNHTEHELHRVEKHAGIKFQLIKPPTAEQVNKAAINDAVRTLDDVDKNVIQFYHETALQLIDTRGAVEALSAALAVIGGGMQAHTVSLITSRRGFTTFKYQASVEMNSVGYVKRVLEKKLPMIMAKSVTSMRMCADRMSCVFDIPSHMEKALVDQWTDTKYDKLEKLTKLPDLAPVQVRDFEGREKLRQGNWNDHRNNRKGYASDRSHYRGTRNGYRGYQREKDMDDYGFDGPFRKQNYNS